MSGPTRVVQGKIPVETADWFDENFPHGFKQEFIRRCFDALYDAVENRRVLPTFQVYYGESVAAALQAAILETAELHKATIKKEIEK